MDPVGGGQTDRPSSQDAPATLDITESRHGPMDRLALTGELDVLTSSRFLGALESAMQRVPRGVEIDATGLVFVDSAGLRSLITSWQRAMQLGVDLAVVNPSPTLARLLEVTGLSHLLGEPA